MMDATQRSLQALISRSTGEQKMGAAEMPCAPGADTGEAVRADEPASTEGFDAGRQTCTAARPAARQLAVDQQGVSAGEEENFHASLQRINRLMDSTLQGLKDNQPGLLPVESVKPTMPADEGNVTSILAVTNVDYHRLSANPALLSSFQEAMKRAIAAAAGPGITPRHVELSLSSGSVVVTATITPPRGISADSVRSELESARLGRSAALTVAGCAGIREVATGPIHVTEVRHSPPKATVRLEADRGSTGAGAVFQEIFRTALGSADLESAKQDLDMTMEDVPDLLDSCTERKDVFDAACADEIYKAFLLCAAVDPRFQAVRSPGPTAHHCRLAAEDHGAVKNKSSKRFAASADVPQEHDDDGSVVKAVLLANNIKLLREQGESSRRKNCSLESKLKALTRFHKGNKFRPRQPFAKEVQLELQAAGEVRAKLAKTKTNLQVLRSSLMQELQQLEGSLANALWRRIRACSGPA